MGVHKTRILTTVVVMSETDTSTVDVMVTVGIGLLGYGYAGFVGAGWSLLIGGLLLGILVVVLDV